MKATRTKKPTVSLLADKLGITTRRVSQLKSEGMPTDSIHAAQAWRDKQAGKQDRKSDSAEELRQRRIALLKAQERKVRLETDEREGKLVSIDETEASIYQCTVAAKMALWSLIGTLPGQLAGLDEVGIHRILDAEFRRVLDMLADGHPLFWKSEIGTKALAYLDKLHAERATTQKKTV